MKHFLLGFFLLSTSFFAYGDTLVKDLNEGMFTWTSDEVLVTQILEVNSEHSKEHTKFLFPNGNCEVYIPTISGSSKRSMERGSYNIARTEYNYVNSYHTVIIQFYAWSKTFSKKEKVKKITSYAYLACTIPQSKYPKKGSLTVSDLNKELQGSGIIIVVN